MVHLDILEQAEWSGTKWSRVNLDYIFKTIVWIFYDGVK